MAMLSQREHWELVCEVALAPRQFARHGRGLVKRCHLPDLPFLKQVVSCEKRDQQDYRDYSQHQEPVLPAAAFHPSFEKVGQSDNCDTCWPLSTRLSQRQAELLCMVPLSKAEHSKFAQNKPTQYSQNSA